jgi:hypothetical protein
VFTEDTTVERHFDKDDLRKLFNLAPPGVCEVMEKVQKAAQGLQSSWGEYQFVLSHRGVVGLSRHDGFYNNKPDKEDDEKETAFDGKVPAVKKVLGRSQRVLQTETIEKMAVGRTVIEIDDKENATIEIVSTPTASIIDVDDDDKENATIEIVSTPTASIIDQADEVEVVDPPTPCEDIESEATEWQDEVDAPTPYKDIESEAFEGQEEVDPPTPYEDIESEAFEGQEEVDPSTPYEDMEGESNDVEEPEQSVATTFQRVELLASNGYTKPAFKLLLDMLEHRYDRLDKEEKIEVHTQICLAARALGLHEESSGDGLAIT